MEANNIISSGILELYATGLALEEEAKRVEQYTMLYPEVAIELAEIEARMEMYAKSFAVEPHPSIKDKIFVRINTENTIAKVVTLTDHSFVTSAKVIGIPSFWKFATIASVILLVASVAFNGLMYNKSNSIAKSLQQTEQELVGLREENKLIEGDMHVVQNKYSKSVSLHGLDAAPAAAAKIFWMENTGEVYIDPSNLPEAPTGKKYQLWGIVDGKPVSGGMILTSKKGDKFRIQKMKTFGRVEAFAVTLENESDNIAPKGPMYVMGKM